MTITMETALPAAAVTEGNGAGAERFRFAELAFPGIGMKTGDVLIIDTKRLEVTLNGKSALDRLTDDSDLENLQLHPGPNILSVDQDGQDTAPVSVSVSWRDRWV